MKNECVAKQIGDYNLFFDIGPISVRLQANAQNAIPNTSFVLSKGIWLVNLSCYIYGGFSANGWYRLLNNSDPEQATVRTDCKTATQDFQYSGSYLLNVEQETTVQLYVFNPNTGSTGDYNIMTKAGGIKLQ